MTRGDRTTIIPIREIAICTIAALAGCGGASKKEVWTARHSRYDTAFARVYTAALEATRKLYPNLDDSPGPGKIRTAWHQVALAGNGNAEIDAADTGMNAPVGTMSAASNSPAAAQGGMPTQLVMRRYFIRFDVTVLGGRPWRVRVVGHASEWDPGAAMPVEMKGANRPPWLQPRIDALEVAIYRRVAKYAVRVKAEPKKSFADKLPKTDPAAFKGIPHGAAVLLAALKDALARRDYTALRSHLAADVVWSLGGGKGAGTALAMWQADPTRFDAMASAIAGGCVAAGAARVTCPGGPVVANKFQLVIEPRGAAWRVTSFAEGE